MQNNRDNWITSLLIAIVVITSYWFFHFAYDFAAPFPYSQELVLALLGAVVTMLITALLLHKQTEFDLSKEQAIKFLELKSDIYQSFIDRIEKMIIQQTLSDRDFIELDFLTHRLAIVASPDVLTEYNDFLNVFTQGVKDDKALNPQESDNISRALARVTVRIRADLIGELDRKSGIHADNIARQIIRNAEDSMNAG